MAERGPIAGRTRLLGVAAALALTTGACATTGEVVQNSSTRPVTIPQGGVSQTFVARADRLSSFTVTTGTFGVDDPDAVLKLAVEGPDGTLRESLLDGDDLGDIAPATFVFPWFEGSAGREFTATLTVAGSSPIAVFANEHDPYPDGFMRPGPGDLTFALGHAGRVSGAVAAAGRIARDFGGNLASDPLFAVVWAGLIGLAVAGLRTRRRGAGVS